MLLLFPFDPISSPSIHIPDIKPSALAHEVHNNRIASQRPIIAIRRENRGRQGLVLTKQTVCDHIVSELSRTAGHKSHNGRKKCQRVDGTDHHPVYRRVWTSGARAVRCLWSGTWPRQNRFQLQVTIQWDGRSSMISWTRTRSLLRQTASVLVKC